jgi:lactoylglutathione lyase
MRDQRSPMATGRGRYETVTTASSRVHMAAGSAYDAAVLSSSAARPAPHSWESLMQVAYVVLYVNDADACRRFWVDQIGMVEKRRTEVRGFTIAQVGFADQPFAFELVPLALMADNPDGLDLATPSTAFRADDLQGTQADLVRRGVQASEVGEHDGTPSFAFSDPEGRWFAVIE